MGTEYKDCRHRLFLLKRITKDCRRSFFLLKSIFDFKGKEIVIVTTPTIEVHFKSFFSSNLSESSPRRHVRDDDDRDGLLDRVRAGMTKIVCTNK
jgi:hypothetical protein